MMNADITEHLWKAFGVSVLCNLQDVEVCPLQFLGYTTSCIFVNESYKLQEREKRIPGEGTTIYGRYNGSDKRNLFHSIKMYDVSLLNI